jgi:DNA (cytosine-5)-methyltransferase 1
MQNDPTPISTHGASPLIYGSVCSGIESATVAWHHLGWKPAFFSEIDPFPRAVLQHHYPTVPLHGDFTTIQEDDYAALDLLVGGTPCQSFSVAGLRKGLADERGNLTLEFVRLAEGLRPRWVVWENVPGVLSQDRGRAFGSFLGGLAELGYGFAYRVLDARHFGVPQRRRRVFVVGHLGDWRPAAAVLFEPESLCRDLAPGREAGEGAAAGPPLRAGGNRTGGGRSPGTDVDTAESLIAFPATMSGTQRASSWDVSPSLGASNPTAVARCRRGGSNRQDGTANAILTSNGGRAGIGVGAVAYRVHGEHSTAMTGNGVANVADPVDVARCLDTCGGYSTNQGGNVVAQAFQQNTRDELRYVGGDGRIAGALAAEPGMKPQNFVQQLLAVRRLTPRECERLQGFPDDYTLVPYRGKPAADGPRYKALGNSMAVPIMRWLGERINEVDQLVILYDPG